MSGRYNTLFAVAAAHTIQDGLVALQYVLLPVLASTLGLSYAQVGVLKAIGSGALALLEIPSGLLAEKVSERILLVVGLVAAACGYIVVSMSATFYWVAAGFLLAGCGGGFQQSLSSSLLVKQYRGPERRRHLGTYNSSGDVGKLSFSALFGLLIGAGLAWDQVVLLLAVTALPFAVLVYWLLAPRSSPRADQPAIEPAATSGWGIIQPARFTLIAAATLLDGIVQAVFLTFIAFVLLHKGATPSVATLAVVMTLAGGMVGKFAGGYLAATVGDRVAFQLLQLLTIVGLLAIMALPATTILLLLPLIGVGLQGSSTIYYGSVADCVAEAKQSRVYGLIYTLANGASVLGPLLLAPVADQYGLNALLWILVVITAMTMVVGVGFAKSNPA